MLLRSLLSGEASGSQAAAARVTTVAPVEEFGAALAQAGSTEAVLTAALDQMHAVVRILI